MADSNVKYNKIQGLLADRVGAAEEDDIMVYDTAKGVVHILNFSAASVFDALEKANTVEGLLAVLLEQYEVDPNVMRDGIQDILNDFVRIGLIEVTGPLDTDKTNQEPVSVPVN